MYVPPAQRHRPVNTDSKIKKNASNPKIARENGKTTESKSKKLPLPDADSTKIVSEEECRHSEDENGISQVQRNNECEIIKEEKCDCGESATTTKTLECELERSTENMRLSDDDCIYSDQNEKTLNGKSTVNSDSLESSKQEDSTVSSAAESEDPQNDPVEKKDTNSDAKCELIIAAKKLKMK